MTGHSGQHPKKDFLVSEPSIMEDASPMKNKTPPDISVEMTTNAEVSIASEFDYDASKYVDVSKVQTTKHCSKANDFLGMSAFQTVPVHNEASSYYLNKYQIIATTKSDHNESPSLSDHKKDKVTEEENDDEESLDWLNAAEMCRIVARQKLAETKGEFDPYNYFGALNMPEIPLENQPADWRI